MGRKKTETDDDFVEMEKMNPANETRKIVDYLRCNLTDEELLETGKQLARANAQRAEAESHKKEIDSQLKADIEKHASRALSLSVLLNNGYEYRNVECQQVKDFAAGTVTVIRNDTGEIVLERPLTADERQAALPIGEATEGQGAQA